MLVGQPISFQPLTLADLPLMLRWLNETSAVHTWYAHGKAVSMEQVVAKYGVKIRGEEPCAPYLICHGTTPIGYIQTYWRRDFPELLEYRWRERPDEPLQIPDFETAAGLDLFIGEPAYLHRGLGAPILEAFLRQVVFADPIATCCLIDPEEANTSALQVYGRVGFRNLGVLLHADEPGPVCLLRIERAAIAPLPGSC